MADTKFFLFVLLFSFYKVTLDKALVTLKTFAVLFYKHFCEYLSM